MALDLTQAKQQLATLVTGTYTTDDLLNLARQADITAEGGITVLYSGEVQGIKTSAIAAEMASDPSIRVIDKTVASKLLISNEFMDALAATKGLSLAQMKDDGFSSPEKTSLLNWLYDSKTGPWAESSKRFVEATVGEVKIMTTSPRLNSVLYDTELPALLEKLKNTNSITQVDGFSRTDLLKIGTSYSTNWTDVMRNALVNNAITQTHFSKPTSGNYSAFVDLTADGLKDLMGAANATDLNNWHNYLSKFEVPPAATKVLNKLGIVGGLLGFGLAATSAAAEEARGNTAQAKEIMKLWAVDAAGSEAASVIGGVLGGIAVTALAAVGVTLSAPLAGAIVVGATLIGGIFGGDAATGVYQLTKDLDDNGRMDLLDKLGNLVFGANYTITTPLPADLNGERLTLDTTFSREAIVANAKTNIAWRYALRELNPFVIPDISYANHNSDGSLDLYDEATGLGAMTELYLQDRAAMLTWKIRFDRGELDDDDSPHTGVKPYNQDWDTNAVDGNWDFVDLSIKLPGGAPLTLAIDGRGISISDHQIVFGSKAVDTIDGSGDSDHLYGMSGDDTLNGGKGDDYLEGNDDNDSLSGGVGSDTLLGGAGNDTLEGGKGNDSLNGGTGNDTYVFTSGDGWDWISDTDGLGQIKYDGVALTGGEYVSRNFWQKKDTEGRVKFTYVLTDETENGQPTRRLTITGTDGGLIIKNWQAGQLGLILPGAPGEATQPPTVQPPPPETTIAGSTNASFLDNWGNHTDFNASGSFTRYPNMLGGAGATYIDGNFATDIKGGQGNTWIVGRSPNNTTSTGDQTIRGGQGETFISTGAAAGTFIGGAGKTLIDARFYRTFEVYNVSTSSYRFYDWDAIGSGFHLSFGLQPIAEYKFNVVVDTEEMASWGYYVDTAGLQDGDNLYVAQPMFNAISGNDGSGGHYSFNPDDWSITVTDVNGQSSTHLIGEYSRLIPNPKSQTLIGGQSDSVLLANDAGNTLIGGSGTNVMVGGKGIDHLFAGALNDTIDGGKGDDFIQGGAGDSHLTGGDGSNTIEGGSGNEVIYAGKSGNDWATAGESWINYVAGGGGNDVIYGTGGQDTLLGGIGNDTLRGGGSSDQLDGGLGEDYLDGGAGDDILQGGAGNDELNGGTGNDTLNGGAGTDYLSGGAGDDTYLFNRGDSPLNAFGQCEVIDDSEGNNSVVFSGSSLADTRITRSGDYMAIVNGNDQLLVKGGFAGAIKSFSFADGRTLAWTTLVNRYFNQNQNQSSSTPNSPLVGGALGDVLNGTGGGTQFYGGLGDDTLSGSGGNNTYFYEQGDGNDRISDTSAKTDTQGQPAPNSLNFGSGIKADNIRVATESGTLVLRILNDDGTESGSVRIDNFDFTVPLRAPTIDRFVFENGTVFGLGDLLAKGFEGTDAADTQLYGTTLADRIDGAGGNDYINGFGGDDTLIGGTGDDTLIGDDGNDVFVFNAGDGNDLITDFTPEDKIQFGSGIAVSDLTLTAGTARNGTTALMINTGSDTVAISDGLSHAIGTVQFADAGNLTLSQLMAQAKTQSATVKLAGGNFIFSGVANDVLKAGSGNDTISSWGAGSTLTAGSGNDVLEAHGANSILIGGLGNDTLSADGGGTTLVAGAAHNQLTASGGNNAYVLTQGGTTEITDSSDSGTETLWLPTGMRLADFIPVRLDQDLVLVSQTGDTQATIKGFFSAKPAGQKWVISSDSEPARFLNEWATERFDAPADYDSRIEAVRNTFSARLAAEANLRGQNGQSLGLLPIVENSYYHNEDSGVWAAVGNYHFGGITTTAITATGTPLNLGASEVDTVEVVQQLKTFTYEVPVYSTEYSSGNSYVVTWPSGVSGFAYPGNASVTNVTTEQNAAIGIQSFLIINPGTYRQVLTGYNTVSKTVSVSTALVDRNFTIQNVTGNSDNQVIIATSDFVGTITTGDGNDFVNLGTTSATVGDWLYERLPLGWNRMSNEPHGLGAFVQAGNGNDTIIGTDGNDILIAGIGNDFLDGGRGADTYYVSLADNSLTTIDDSGNPGMNAYLGYGGGDFPLDTLVFPDEIRPQNLEVRVFADPDHPGQKILEIRHGQANVLVVFADPVGSTPNGRKIESSIGVERFQFSDGTTLTRDQLIAQATLLPNDFAPVVTALDQSIMQNQSIAAASLFTASDTGNNVFSRYEFTNEGEDGGHFVLSGKVFSSNESIDIAASDLAKLRYVGGSTEGGDTVNIRAFDGAVWSDWQALNVATVLSVPEIHVSENLTVHPYQVVSIKDYFTVTDPANLAITQYQFNVSQNNAGFLTLSGEPISQTLTVDAANLSTVHYISRSVSATDSIQVRAFDGRGWSEWTALELAPVITDHVIQGAGDNQIVTGDIGKETLVSGGRDNTLVGGTGSDTFVVSLGSGLTTIRDTAKAKGDVIQFDANISADSVWVGEPGTDLTINFGDQGDQIVIKDFQAGVAGGPSVIRRFQYVDGGYSTYAKDAQGNTKWQNRDASGRLASDTWTHVDGNSGGDSFATDGMIERWVTFNYADGTTDWTDTYTYPDGSSERDWGKRDGSNGYTVVNADGSRRSNTTNADGSYSNSTDDGHGNKTTQYYTAANILTKDTWTKSDGSRGSDVFNADGSSRLEIITTDASGATVNDVKNFNADGSLKTETITTRTDTLTVSYVRDTNGDSLVEQRQLVVKDATGAKVDDLKNYNSDGSLKTETTTSTSADGLTVSYIRDTNGDGVVEQRQLVVKDAAGAKVDDLKNYNTDGSLKTDTTTSTSADGLTASYIRDTNGDGVVEQRESIVKDSVGAKVDDLKNYNADGSLKTETTTSTSADGLTISYIRDTNGDGVIEQRQLVVKDATGAKVDGLKNYNADGSLKTETTTSTSADGLTVSYVRDTNGDGVVEQRESLVKDATGAKVDDLKNFNADGSLTSETITSTDAAGTVLSKNWLLSDGRQGVDADSNHLAIGTAGGNSLGGLSGNELLIGGAGKDTLTTGTGTTLFAFNAGDGQDTVKASTGDGNAISLGGALSYGDLAFQKSGNSLVLDVGSSDSLVFKDWYASPSNQKLVTLQVIAEAMTDFAQGSTDDLRNQKIETFDFQKLVSDYDQARTTNSTLNYWNLSNALLDAHLSGSNSAALGGDLAYEYGLHGNLTGFNGVAADTIVAATSFAKTPQTLQPWSAVSGGSATLR